jgi:hypothetical protein
MWKHRIILSILGAAILLTVLVGVWVRWRHNVEGSLPTVLKRATFIHIDQYWGKDQPVTNGVMLTAQKYPEFFRLVKSCGQFHETPPATKPDYTVLMFYTLTKSYNYQYVSSTGELGKGREWCVVPEAFKQWVLKHKEDHFMLDGQRKHKSEE